jgi:hypothetical protein
MRCPFSFASDVPRRGANQAREEIEQAKIEEGPRRGSEKSNPLAVIQRKPLESDLSVARAGLMSALGRKRAAITGSPSWLRKSTPETRISELQSR